MKYFCRARFQVLVFHRRVRSTKVNGLCLNLLDSATRSDRLIVDAHIRMEFAVLAEPFLIQGIGKCCAGAL